MGTRLTGGIVGLLVAATSYTAWTLSLGKRAVIRKIMWYNNTGGASVLEVGFLTNAAVPVFTAVLPRILMVNGNDGQIPEDQLPIAGNTPEGFQADTTANTGTLGNIIVQATVGGALPTCTCIIEVEEF